uniref:restriction endonuclease subunit S n=1 Tax=Segatella hominis TaxID=2518605 RepID=UPI00402A23C4
MNTKALRQKILDLAIHGKLVPQDPNDEPASVLLERIRAEKERLIKEGKIKKPKKSKAACDKPHYPFELPKGWVWTTLGEIGSWQSGATPSRMNKDYYGGNIPWLKTGDLNDGTITYIPEYITQRALEETSVRLNPKGSILIAMYGATIGKIGILSFPATTNQACCACYEYSINQMFLFYFLLANRENFIAMGGGGAQPNISKEKIISTNMPLPPLKEQERIVAEIERWLSFVDIVEIEKSDLQSTICLAKSKILDLAIHGKLVPQDPNDEPASELLKRINPKAEITCDNPQYGKLPKGWCLCHIPDVANTLLGKTLDRSKNTGTPKDYLCAINVLWGKFDFTTHKQFLLEKNEYERYAVMKGDLMVCEGGDVGRCAIWEDDSKEIYYQNALHRIRCKEGVFNYYILYLLWHYKLNGTIDYLCKGVTIKHFTQTVMNKLDILLPPFEEQKRIVAKIEDLFTQLDKIESSLQA